MPPLKPGWPAVYVDVKYSDDVVYGGKSRLQSNINRLHLFESSCCVWHTHTQRTCLEGKLCTEILIAIL